MARRLNQPHPEISAERSRHDPMQRPVVFLTKSNKIAKFSIAAIFPSNPKFTFPNFSVQSEVDEFADRTRHDCVIAGKYQESLISILKDFCDVSIRLSSAAKNYGESRAKESLCSP